jgi:hypothetical protein
MVNYDLTVRDSDNSVIQVINLFRKNLMIKKNHL